MLENKQINDNFVKNLIELNELKNMTTTDEEFITLVHGTLMSMEEIQQLIFNNGLYATGYNEESSLMHTTNPVDVNSYDVSQLDDKLKNWSHASNNFIFIRLPLQYFNIYADHGDRDCLKTRIFMDKVNIDENTYKYILDPKFIVGVYNFKSGKVLKNPNFESILTNKTKQELQAKLYAFYKEIGIELDIEEINRTL